MPVGQFGAMVTVSHSGQEAIGKESETKITAGVPKYDPSTQEVKKQSKNKTTLV